MLKNIKNKKERKILEKLNRKIGTNNDYQL